MADLVLATFPHCAPDFVKDPAKAKGSHRSTWRRTPWLERRASTASATRVPHSSPRPACPSRRRGSRRIRLVWPLGKRLAALVRGEEAALPTERSARCVAETGGGEGITVGIELRRGLRGTSRTQARARHRAACRRDERRGADPGLFALSAPDSGLVFEVAGAPPNVGG